MRYYQLIYTASEAGRSGQPGFGIRSVSEGFPEYLIPLVDGKMTSYYSGTFENIPGAKLVENPERILKYPRSFFYKVVKLENGKKAYFLGRTVATGFDYPYFKTGNPSTRTGNYVSHIYVFEEAPDSSIFDILFENTLPGQNAFLPANILPTLDNEELKSLVLGPSAPIEMTDGGFFSSVEGVPDKSIDILFDLVSALNEGKRLIVKMDASQTASTCAGLMRLLPEKYAQEMSFFINYQNEGVPSDTRITFVNQYYQYSSLVGNVKIVDYLNSSHAAASLEKKWRPAVVKATLDNDFERVRIISSWLLNKLSTKLVERSNELDWSLIRYFYMPNDFALGEIVEVDGLLQVLSKLIAADPSKGALLSSLLGKEFEEAQDEADINLLITMCEQVAAAGIPIDDVRSKARQIITSFVMSSPANLNGVLQSHSVPTLKKYLDLAQTSKHKEFLSNELLLDKWDQSYSIFYQQPIPVKEVLVSMQSLQLDERQIKTVLKEICPSSSERVKMYVSRLKEHPEEIGIFVPLLEWDQAESDKIDYITEFKNLYAHEEYAGYFIKSIDCRKNNLSPIAALELCKEISDKNSSFKKLLLQNSTIYGALYHRFVDYYVKANAVKSFDSFIATSVLPLIADGNPVKKEWENLRDVLSITIPDNIWPSTGYNLAVDIKAADYIRAIAERGFKHFESLDEIARFVGVLYDIVGYSTNDIVTAAKTKRGSQFRSYYIVAIAKKKNLSFDKVMELADTLSIKDRDAFYAEFFRKEYRIQKFKNLFKLDKENKKK